MKPIDIDDEVKNKITGKKGVVTGKASYKYRTNQLLVFYNESEKEQWEEESVFDLSVSN